MKFDLKIGGDYFLWLDAPEVEGRVTCIGEASDWLGRPMAILQCDGPNPVAQCLSRFGELDGSAIAVVARYDLDVWSMSAFMGTGALTAFAFLAPARLESPILWENLSPLGAASISLGSGHADAPAEN